MGIIIKIITSKQIYVSLFVILISIIIYSIIKKTTNTLLGLKSKINNKKKTIIKLFNNVSKYIIILIDLVIILQVYGVNVTSLIAGLGLVSIIAGLALQDALKDIIMGVNIILDDYFSVGDVITLNGVTGKIIEIGLKCVKLKDIYNDNTYTLSNRCVSDSLLISTQLDIDIPLPYNKTVNEVETVLDVITNQIKKVENVVSVEYKGLNEFSDSSIMYKIRIQAKPEFHPEIKRRTLKIVKLNLDKNNIEIPFTQIDINTK